MAIKPLAREITLLNGVVIQRQEGGTFPPLQEITKIEHACDICQLRQFCQDNNEFDCQVYGMFSGFYFDSDDAISFLERTKQ